MASTASTAHEGGTTVTLGEADRRSDDGEDVHGLPVSTNTQREDVTGEYITDLDDLDAGDDVYVEYRERRDTGSGLTYTPNAMELVGRVVRRDGDAAIIAPDFKPADEVALCPAGKLQSHPTLQMLDGHYGVKHVVRRTDTTPSRRRTVAFFNAVRDRGIEARYDAMSNTEPVTVRPDTPDEYRFTVGLIKHVREEHGVDVDASARWYETEDDLMGEEGWKEMEAVERHDAVSITVGC